MSRKISYVKEKEVWVQSYEKYEILRNDFLKNGEVRLCVDWKKQYCTNFENQPGVNTSRIAAHFSSIAQYYLEATFISDGYLSAMDSPQWIHTVLTSFTRPISWWFFCGVTWRPSCMTPLKNLVCIFCMNSCRKWSYCRCTTPSCECFTIAASKLRGVCSSNRPQLWIFALKRAMTDAFFCNYVIL